MRRSVLLVLLLVSACGPRVVGGGEEAVTIRYEPLRAGPVDALTRASEECARYGRIARPADSGSEGVPLVGMRYATFRCVPPE